MNSYWLTLSVDAFLWIKNDNVLVYNSKNGKSVKFIANEQITKICLYLLELKNLYSIEIFDYESDRNVKKWIRSLIKIEAAIITQINNTKNKPVSFAPHLRIQYNKGYYQYEHNNGIGGSIINNLHDISVYINGSYYGDHNKYKQTLFPLNIDYNINTKKMLNFLSGCKNPYLNQINIIGNIFNLENYSNIINVINNFEVRICIYIIYNDYMDNIEFINTLHFRNLHFVVLMNTGLEDMNKKKNIFKCTKQFIITNSDEIINSKITIDSQCNIVPYYNNKNIDFFKIHVFTEIDDLRNLSLSKRDIFIRQTLNIHDFGKLTIMPDGKVYANVNEESLGTIDDYAYDIVYKEFMTGKSWFNIRNQKPCSDCVYQWLCPSPSNYERAIGKPNLCHIKV